MTADDRRPMPPLPPPLHPDLDTLADLQADALDRSTAERVRSHVTGCAQCAGVIGALDAVGAELRGLPTPAMPAAVAARLDATFADLRRGDLDEAPATPRPLLTVIPGDRSTNDPGDRSQGDRSQGDRSQGDRSPTDRSPADRTSEGPDGRAPGKPTGRPPLSEAAAKRAADRELYVARERKRRRRTRVYGAAAAAVAVLAAGSSITAIVRAGSNGGDDSTALSAGDAQGGADTGAVGEQLPAPGSASPGVTISIPSYDRSTLRTQLPDIVKQSAVSIITGDTGPAGAMADAGRRTACANTIRGSSGRLQGVLRIRYEGRPAYVFVFASGEQSTAYVVPDDCGTRPALPAAVLDTVS